MSSPFVSSLRSSLAATNSNKILSSESTSATSKSAMMSLFSGLDLALDSSGAIVSNGRSAAKDLLASKNAEKQAEAELAASQALKKQRQKQQQEYEKKTQPVSALTQAMNIFEQEMEERDAFTSRNTKRRQKSSKKNRAGDTMLRGRLKRHQTYQRV